MTQAFAFVSDQPGAGDLQLKVQNALDRLQFELIPDLRKACYNYTGPPGPGAKKGIIEQGGLATADDDVPDVEQNPCLRFEAHRGSALLREDAQKKQKIPHERIMLQQVFRDKEGMAAFQNGAAWTTFVAALQEWGEKEKILDVLPPEARTNAAGRTTRAAAPPTDSTSVDDAGAATTTGTSASASLPSSWSAFLDLSSWGRGRTTAGAPFIPSTSSVSANDWFLENDLSQDFVIPSTKTSEDHASGAGPPSYQFTAQYARDSQLNDWKKRAFDSSVAATTRVFAFTDDPAKRDSVRKITVELESTQLGFLFAACGESSAASAASSSSGCLYVDAFKKNEKVTAAGGSTTTTSLLAVVEEGQDDVLTGSGASSSSLSRTATTTTTGASVTYVLQEAFSDQEAFFAFLQRTAAFETWVNSPEVQAVMVHDDLPPGRRMYDSLPGAAARDGDDFVGRQFGLQDLPSLYSLSSTIQFTYGAGNNLADKFRSELFPAVKASCLQKLKAFRKRDYIADDRLFCERWSFFEDSAVPIAGGSGGSSLPQSQLLHVDKAHDDKNFPPLEGTSIKDVEQGQHIANLTLLDKNVPTKENAFSPLLRNKFLEPRKSGTSRTLLSDKNEQLQLNKKEAPASPAAPLSTEDKELKGSQNIVKVVRFTTHEVYPDRHAFLEYVRTDAAFQNLIQAVMDNKDLIDFTNGRTNISFLSKDHDGTGLMPGGDFVRSQALYSVSAPLSDALFRDQQPAYANGSTLPAAQVLSDSLPQSESVWHPQLGPQEQTSGEVYVLKFKDDVPEAQIAHAVASLEQDDGFFPSLCEACRLQPSCYYYNVFRSTGFGTSTDVVRSAATDYSKSYTIQAAFKNSVSAVDQFEQTPAFSNFKAFLEQSSDLFQQDASYKSLQQYREGQWPHVVDPYAGTVRSMNLLFTFAEPDETTDAGLQAANDIIATIDELQYNLIPNLKDACYGPQDESTLQLYNKKHLYSAGQEQPLLGATQEARRSAPPASAGRKFSGQQKFSPQVEDVAGEGPLLRGEPEREREQGRSYINSNSGRGLAPVLTADLDKPKSENVDPAQPGCLRVEVYADKNAEGRIKTVLLQVVVRRENWPQMVDDDHGVLKPILDKLNESKSAGLLQELDADHEVLDNLVNTSGSIRSGNDAADNFGFLVSGKMTDSAASALDLVVWQDSTSTTSVAAARTALLHDSNVVAETITLAFKPGVSDGKEFTEVWKELNTNFFPSLYKACYKDVDASSRSTAPGVESDSNSELVFTSPGALKTTSAVRSTTRQQAQVERRTRTSEITTPTTRTPDCLYADVYNYTLPSDQRGYLLHFAFASQTARDRFFAAAGPKSFQEWVKNDETLQKVLRKPSRTLARLSQFGLENLPGLFSVQMKIHIFDRIVWAEVLRKVQQIKKDVCILQYHSRDLCERFNVYLANSGVVAGATTDYFVTTHEVYPDAYAWRQHVLNSAAYQELLKSVKSAYDNKNIDASDTVLYGFTNPNIDEKKVPFPMTGYLLRQETESDANMRTRDGAGAAKDRSLAPALALHDHLPNQTKWPEPQGRLSPGGQTLILQLNPKLMELAARDPDAAAWLQMCQNYLETQLLPNIMDTDCGIYDPGNFNKNDCIYWNAFKSWGFTNKVGRERYYILQ
ncbi:unnamed protein product, partial [Amoebophrya sp. A120]